MILSFRVTVRIFRQSKFVSHLVHAIKWQFLTGRSLLLRPVLNKKQVQSWAGRDATFIQTMSKTLCSVRGIFKIPSQYLTIILFIIREMDSRTAFLFIAWCGLQVVLVFPDNNYSFIYSCLSYQWQVYLQI